MISLILGVIILVVLLVIAAAGLIFGQLVWTAACSVAVRLVRPEGKRAFWLAVSIPLYIPCYLLAVVFLIWWVWPDKHDAYESAFGIPPSQSVIVHQGDLSGFADSVAIELHFTATPADIRALTSNGYTLVASDLNRPPPDYPGFPAGIPKHGIDVYEGPAPFTPFEQPSVLIYEPATNLAWYAFDGVH